MFIDVVHYIFKTPLNSIVSDIRGYYKISRDLRETQKNKCMLEKQLVRRLGYANDDMARTYVGCQVSYVKTVPDARTGYNMPVFAHHCCPNFDFLRPCSKCDCVRNVNTNAYFAARDNLAKLSLEKRTFWAEKMILTR